MATAASKHTKMAFVSVKGASHECFSSPWFLPSISLSSVRASLRLSFSGRTFRSRGSAWTHSWSIGMTQPSASASSRPAFDGVLVG